MAAEKVPANLYPKFTLTHITDPNKLWAVPVIGGIIKFLILIPVFIELGVLLIVYILLLLINSLVVLFTGKYWVTCYDFTMGVLRLLVKTYLFGFGVTNKYPGFDFTIEDKFSFDMPMPKNPNRLFAFPILGGVVRWVLMIPFMIWVTVTEYAASFGALAATIPVLFMGKYPESSYEMVRDHTRLFLAHAMYWNGYTEQYPNFWISWNHKGIKILLIVLGILAFLGNLGNHSMYPNQYQNNYYNQQMMQQQYQNGQNNGNMMYQNGQ